MIKIKFLFLLAFITFCNVVEASNNNRVIPVPSVAQLNWQNAEIAAVFHYDLHVFDGVRYSQPHNRITPIADMNIFNPQYLDTDQWIRSVKAMGAKIAIITATHETGFAMYQSDANPYCLKALKWRDGKGDIVRDFVNSCRKYGILPGIYIGIRWNSFLGVHDFMMPNDGSEFQKNRQKFYNRMCERMTEELMSRYGELAVVWYDGGGHGPELGGPDILPIVERYQKNIIFYHNSQRADMRWGGSETGMVPYPCWGTYPFPYSHSKNQDIIFKDDNRLLKNGDPDGGYYMPAMSDVPLRGYNGRHEWFWEPDDESHIQPLNKLIEMYYNSVGHNSTLIIGVTPDPRGLLPAADSIRMKQFGDEIKRRFAQPIAEVRGCGKCLEMNLNRPYHIDAIVLCEDISKGERVRQYKVEGKVNGKWKMLTTGSCIGHKKIDTVVTDKVSALRLRVDKAVDVPHISRFAVYAY